jgi:hypothetical protein
VAIIDGEHVNVDLPIEIDAALIRQAFKGNYLIFLAP